MDPLRAANGLEESGVSGNMIYDILHNFHFKLGLGRVHASILVCSYSFVLSCFSFRWGGVEGILE